MAWLIFAVVLIVVLAVWVTWTANRIDRLHARVEAARASLDAQLLRRAARARELAEEDAAALGPALACAVKAASRAALHADEAGRESAENDLGRALMGLSEVPGRPDEARLSELHEAAVRVGFARRFYNDGVRDLGLLRAQRLPRLARLGARRPVPAFFEIDDRLWPIGEPAPAVHWADPQS